MFHLMKGNVSDNIGNKITHYIIGIIAKDSDDPCKIMLPHADLEPKSSKNLVKLCGFFLKLTYFTSTCNSVMRVPKNAPICSSTNLHPQVYGGITCTARLKCTF